MKTGQRLKRGKNIGWRCTHCDKGRFYGEGSADKAVTHISKEHEARYLTGNWSIIPIRDYEGR